MKKVSSFIRDDLDFLNHEHDTVDEDTTLVTFDVVSLYTNIPTELGIETVKFWTEKYQNLLLDRFPQEFAIQGLKLVLKKIRLTLEITIFYKQRGLQWERMLHQHTQH